MSDLPCGVLLCNLGTPDAPHAPEVKRYLRQFLSDPRVIDIPAPLRKGLLELVILPRRPKVSAEAYAKVWMPEGSPLLVHCTALRDAVAQALPRPRFEVALGMRYGKPAVDAAFAELVAKGCARIVVVPLYPQYAASSTGSTLEVIYGLAARAWNTPAVAVVPPFFDDPRFIAAFEAVARPVLDDARAEHVLMSFHGLPERHLEKGDPTGAHCFAAASCCDAVMPVNSTCYRAQCFATARALAGALAIEDRYSVSFQSRLGRTPWIKPYTDVVLPELVAKGVRRLAVMCPAFTADCLETLEEIGIRARADWKAAGGEELTLVPSLNASSPWVDAVVAMVREHAGAHGRIAAASLHGSAAS